MSEIKKEKKLKEEDDIEEAKEIQKKMKKWIGNHISLFKRFNPSFSKDRILVFAAIKEDNLQLGFCNPKFLLDKEIMMYVLSKRSNFVKYLPKKFSNDRNMALVTFGVKKYEDYYPSKERCKIILNGI